MFRFINNMHDKSQIAAWKIHFQHSPLSETRFKQILSSGIFEFYDCPEIGSIVDYKPIVIFNQEEALLGYFSSQVKTGKSLGVNRRKVVILSRKKVNQFKNDRKANFLEPIKSEEIEEFENETLRKFFNKSYIRVLVKIKESFDNFNRRNKKKVYNWDSKNNNDKTLGQSRSDQRRNNDALASWRRMPGAGFSKS